jgi:hypothetical protein
MEEEVEKKIVEWLKSENENATYLAHQICALFSVSYCATLMKNVLCNRFTNEAKKHVGKKINEVPELTEMLKAIEIVEKHCG